MKPFQLLIGGGLALASALAVAQDAPESLLPPGFDRPATKAVPSRAAAPPTTPAAPAAAPRGESNPVVQQAPGSTAALGSGAVGAVSGTVASAPSAAGIAARLPTIADLENLSPEALDEVLGLKASFDAPASRRAMKQVGILGTEEGGLPSHLLGGQDASLVRAVLAGNKGRLVSRWGHILLRRALASRMDAPRAMDPASFAAMRAALLVRMGEGEVARSLVQDVDAANYNRALTKAALNAYVATADFTGICPVVSVKGIEALGDDAEWKVASHICAAFRGDGASALRKLDTALASRSMDRIDILLAQKYAGAAGKARRAVKIEWDEVNRLTPWRYALTVAVGLEPPANLLNSASAQLDLMAVSAPMLGLSARAAAADRAAGRGLVSSEALVDLYSQIHAAQDISGDWSERSELLRDAYVAQDASARLSAMQQLWDGATSPDARYSRQVLTAYAAARMPAQDAIANGADGLVTSMLAAGLDANAMRWAALADKGSLAWGQLVLAAPKRSTLVDGDALEAFSSNDDSEDGRKSAFLLAGLAGLGRIGPEAQREFAADLEINLGRQTRWTQLISAAADVGNPALVALLAGVGMQGDSWSKMTPLHLYHIVSALNRVGLRAEARMIAAEAVARG